MVALVTVVTDTKIWLHKQPCFRSAELLHAPRRAKRGKNLPAPKPNMPEAEKSASGIFYVVTTRCYQRNRRSLDCRRNRTPHLVRWYHR